MSWHVDFAKPSRRGLNKRDQIARRYGSATSYSPFHWCAILMYFDVFWCILHATWHKFANLWSIRPWHEGFGSLRTWIHSSASKLASDCRSIMIYWQIITCVYSCGLFPNFANKINHAQGTWDHLLKSTSTSCNAAWKSWLVWSRACAVGQSRAR